MMKLARHAPSFQPAATYDPDGDCIKIQDGKVRLVHLIRARLWTSTLDPTDTRSG